MFIVKVEIKNRLISFCDKMNQQLNYLKISLNIVLFAMVSHTIHSIRYYIIDK